ncbi:Oidioi.mRNA.OKI2018_I69.PAR.g12916.t1.cds [Oikopleura dioica]|uniref:Oidioi.mRNA.OKI2018_I69.PAR.g12916.t1.cds n=1 Tax=Oikopleura dioica TaxID=34765 RepID=A0ABN7S8G7_OIKDI|nr:Oidioi.mRNA.OKI2018_I69.PAR.g12916.t1.cds [Oikopleura dioica]
MAELTPQPRGMPMQEEMPGQPQMAAFSSIPEENLTKEQKIAKQNLEAAFGAIKQAFAKVHEGMNYIQQQNLTVAKKLKTVSSIDIRYFHLDIPVKCKMENGVLLEVSELKASKSEWHKGCKFTFIVTTEGTSHHLNIKVHTPAYMEKYEIRFKVYSHYDKTEPVCYSENAKEGDIYTVKISDVTDIYSDPRFHDGIAPETLPVDIEIDFRAMHFRK